MSSMVALSTAVATVDDTHQCDAVFLLQRARENGKVETVHLLHLHLIVVQFLWEWVHVATLSDFSLNVTNFI